MAAFRFRTWLFWTHLVAGLAAGAIIIVMSATGVLLAYERQIVAWADRDGGFVVDAGASRLPVDRFLQAVAAQRLKPTAVTLSSDPAAPALVVAEGRPVALNPYTARILGDASPRTRRFFRYVEDLHRWLAVGLSTRPTGRAITGWSTFLFLGILISGVYLWLPPVWTRAVVRTRTMFRPELRGRARDFNWHTVVGIWTLVPLLVIVLCALPMSFPWANALIYRAAGEAPPKPATPTAARARALAGSPGSADTLRADAFAGLNPLWARAEQQVDGWRTITMRIAATTEPVAFTIDRGSGGQPQLRDTLTINRETGAVTKWETFATQTPGRRARTLARFAHTGEFFGLPGQTIAAAASAGAVALVATGMTMAVRRLLRARVKRPRTVPAESAAA